MDDRGRDRPLRAGLIGCGAMGWRYDEAAERETVLTHAKAYAESPDVQLTGVCDRRAEAAEACAERWGGTSFTDPVEMLEACSFDVVSVCTPTSSHLEMLELLLESQVPAVWCEKPLAGVEDDPGPVVRAYGAKNKILAVNYLRRWEPEHARIRGKIRDGSLGRLDKAMALYSKGFLHSGSHFVDLFRSWFGEVTAWDLMGVDVDVLEGDPNVDLRLEFESGPDAYVLGTDERSYSMDEVHLFAEEARMWITDYARSVLLYPRVRDPITGAGAVGREPKVRETSMDRVMELVLRDIAQAVRDGGNVACDGGSALRTFELCREIARSSRGQI